MRRLMNLIVLKCVRRQACAAVCRDMQEAAKSSQGGALRAIVQGVQHTTARHSQRSVRAVLSPTYSGRCVPEGGAIRNYCFSLWLGSVILRLVRAMWSICAALRAVKSVLFHRSSANTPAGPAFTLRSHMAT